MHIIIILLLGISVCIWLGRSLFAGEKSKKLQMLFYGLAIALSVMLLYALFLAIVLGNSFF